MTTMELNLRKQSLADLIFSANEEELTKLEKDNYIRIAAIFDCRQNPDKLSRNL